jgi:steroid delta-isomerase-like uncharacterized protein
MPREAFQPHGTYARRPRGRAPRPAVAIVIAALSTAPLSAQPVTPTPSQAAESLARRYFNEVWNQGNVDVLDELLAPDYVNHTPSIGTPPRGPDGLKPIVLAMRRAFPDLHFSIEDVVAAGDAVAIRTTMTGTHHGDLFGTPPTHRRVRVNQIQIERVQDGRIVEHWRVTDELTLMKQLGVVRTP